MFVRVFKKKNRYLYWIYSHLEEQQLHLNFSLTTLYRDKSISDNQIFWINKMFYSKELHLPANDH